MATNLPEWCKNDVKFDPDGHVILTTVCQTTSPGHQILGQCRATYGEYGVPRPYHGYEPTPVKDIIKCEGVMKEKGK